MKRQPEAEGSVINFVIKSFWFRAWAWNGN